MVLFESESEPQASFYQKIFKLWIVGLADKYHVQHKNKINVYMHLASTKTLPVLSLANLASSFHSDLRF
jgi:hypothetical protein